MTPDQLEINVREAVVEDIPDIVTMAEEFFKLSPYSSVSSYMPLKASETLTDAINNPEATTLVVTVNNLPVGFLMALKHPSMWSDDVMAVETVFWVEPSLRNLGLGSLLKAKYLNWCLNNQVSIYALGNTLGMDTTEQIDNTMKKNGFLPAEAIYIKAVRCP